MVLSAVRRFVPKVKSSKMGLSITPRGWGSEPTRFQATQPHFLNIWPLAGPNIKKNAGFSPFGAGYSSEVFQVLERPMK